MSLACKARCCLLTPESPCITNYCGPRLHAAAQTCSLTLRPATPRPIADQSPSAPRPIATLIPEGAGLPSGATAAERHVERRRACSEPPSQRAGDVVTPAEKAWTLNAFGVRPCIDDGAYQRRPQSGPPKHEFSKIDTAKALKVFGISTGIDDDTHQRKRALEAPIPRPTKLEMERMAVTFSDITRLMARRHFHDAPPPGSSLSTNSRLAALDAIDIDAHRGRCHFPEDCMQPWAKPSYDDAVGSTPQATRRHFFEMQYAAECYAQLIGRPHIRKPSELPALPAARSEWLRRKELEEGWQLLGSWHKPVFAKKKPFGVSRPLWELEMHNHLCSIVVGKKKHVGMVTLSEESFRQACLEKPRSAVDEGSFDGSTASPEESVLASEDEVDTSVIGSPVHKTRRLPKITEGDDDGGSTASLEDSVLASEDEVDTSVISIPVQKTRRLPKITERDDDTIACDEANAAKLPLALRRVIAAAVAGAEETLDHAPAPLAKQIRELVCNSQQLF